MLYWIYILSPTANEFKIELHVYVYFYINAPEDGYKK
jgi:hypothetical protein